MKHLVTFAVLLCALQTRADFWTRKADFPGTPRAGAYFFSIGNKGYVGGGLDSNFLFYQDLWEYNPTLDKWTSKANFQGTARGYSASFSIGNKGYVCIGGNTLGDEKNDLWQFDGILNSWTKKTDFPGGARCCGVGFVINDIAYVGAGIDTTVDCKDFYAYHQATDSWVRIADIPTGMVEATAFSILGKGYVTAPYTSQGVNDSLWEYDPSLNVWNGKANFPDTARTDAASFTIGNKGYFGTGDFAGATKILANDFWQYDPAKDLWSKKASLPSTTRDETAYFSIGNKGYICFGGEHWNAELWEYTADNLDVSELSSQNAVIQMYPNPAKDQITIRTSLVSTFTGPVSVRIYDLGGRLVMIGNLPFSQGETKINLSLLPGMYMVHVSSGEKEQINRLIIN